MIDFKSTFLLPLPAHVFGYLFILAGLYQVVMYQNLGFLILTAVGLLVSFSRHGVLFNYNENRFKEYQRYFWVKMSAWKSLKDCPSLTVLTITEKTAVRSLANNAFTTKELVYRITLLSENHREKIRLIQLKDEAEAHKECERLADLLGLDKTVYSPYQ